MYGRSNGSLNTVIFCTFMRQAAETVAGSENYRGNCTESNQILVSILCSFDPVQACEGARKIGLFVRLYGVTL